MALTDFIRPEVEASRRDDLAGPTGAYLRCYLLLRLVVGAVGALLPVALLIGDGIFLSGPFAVRGSLSAYYHSGMRDVFVGSLCAISVFLVTYKVFEKGLDNSLSILAGTAVLVVAVFPTDRPDRISSPETPLQHTLGETTVATIHYIAAAVFIVSLGIISYFFGVREGKRDPSRGQRRSPAFWRRFHWICAGAIVIALAYIAASNSFGWLPDRYSLLIGESVAVVAFGISWFAKGLERDMLARLRDAARRRREALASSRTTAQG